jgi:hypothetical protein
MKTRLILATFILAMLAQIPGCHYYVDAVPRLIISSEQFNLPPAPETIQLNHPGETNVAP